MRLLKPNLYVKSLKKIDFRKLRRKGYKGLIFDIDNTLVPHGKGINKDIKKFIQSLIDMGYRVGFVSNNDEKRVNRFNRHINLPFISKAKKPLPCNYKKLVEKLGLSCKNVIFIGDQLFTDILGANIAGIKSILVHPIDTENEPANIKFKRILERIYIRRYEKTGEFI